MKSIFFTSLFLILSSLFCILSASEVKAQTFDEEYAIRNFTSDINIEKDTTLNVSEAIEVFFPDSRHGIYRTIPVVYNVRGKTLRADLEVVSVENGKGQKFKYEVSRLYQSIKIKIGDPDQIISGPVTYVIKYRISDIVKRYEDYDEIYWNVTGSQWDTEIKNAKVNVDSDYANITKIDCFSGVFGGSDRFCESAFAANSASFRSTTKLGPGRDFTIVIALDKNNRLTFPGPVKNLFTLLRDNWGFAVSVFPLLFFSYYWLKKGRDQKYLSDNIYYLPKDQKEIIAPLLKREFLPTVYSPINEITPSQAGTIIDEKVDIDDVIAEILELARLGYIKIAKIETKKIFGEKIDYMFTKQKKDLLALADFQLYLFNGIFKGKLDSTTLSSLKNTFYTTLSGFKDRLYVSLKDKVFDGRPDAIKGFSIGKFVIIELICFVVLTSFSSATGNSFPLFAQFIFSIPTLIFAINMPRRTAWGYSLYRQIKGLEYYLAKGKWRLEIAEKHQFFGEMLPLAVALGIVNKFSGDMKELGIKPPEYFSGVTAGSMASDLGNFRTTTASTFTSNPSNSGSSSWTGGSGFSGGSSGGGSGGGGGGSW